MSVLTPSAELGPESALAQRLPDYELRPQQQSMADAVGRALSAKSIAIVEAPTGVGKSFAYLLPAARHALASQRKVVISTATIALQEQLIHKDIPLVRSLYPGLRAVLVKGRQNYLSLRRLEHSATGQQALFEDREQVRQLQHLVDWSARTSSGELNDLDTAPDPKVWRMVQSDKGNCLGRRCPRYDECFFYAARREIEGADLIIVNHHLYFSDLALRDAHAGILPAHDAVIFDEAHALEDVATEHLGRAITEAQVHFYLDGLHGRGGKGLLAEAGFAGAIPLVETAVAANRGFWAEITAAAPSHDGEYLRLGTPHRFANPVSPALDDLRQALAALQSQAKDENQLQELKAQAERAAELAGTLRALLGQELGDYVYYATIPSGRGSPSLAAHPLSVAELLRERLFDGSQAVVLTSATLAADDSERFLFLRKRLGIEGGEALRLDSPFDFQRQARLLVNESPLDPNGERYERAVAQWLGDFLDDAPGGTFVLFTSYRQLAAVHDLLLPRLERANRFVLRQGGPLGRSRMIDLFKQTGNAVLFGTSSFWEGVDVRGEALRNVVICKLPFEMPAHPLVEARHAAITANGGNAFMERSVPEAILRLKQGIGRLIRTRSDSGAIAILDHRVLTKQYGRYFLRALPPMPLERVRI